MPVLNGNTRSVLCLTYRVQRVVNKLSMYLKPGGIFLFRDYGRFDLSQLKFKRGEPPPKAPYDVSFVDYYAGNLCGKCVVDSFIHSKSFNLSQPGQCLSDHFYARGDGTCVYFFTKGSFQTFFFSIGAH